MADPIKVRTYVTYWQDDKYDLDLWEEYGYESKEQMRNILTDVNQVEEYWDITNNFDGMPKLKVEVLDEA